MTHKQAMMNAIAAVMLLAMAPFAPAANSAAAAPAAQKTFASPDAAGEALADAVRSGNVTALLAVVGPASRSWLSSGDAVADRADWKKFLAAYERKHAVDQASDGRAFLIVGDDAWPFPAPIRRQGGGWAFDAEAGREEMINRRIGRNELATIQTLLAVVDAQREYAAADPDGDGFHDYARKFRSSEGKRDGLFWPTAAGEAPSPLGELMAHAAREGYGGKAGTRTTGGKAGPAAYHGYHYRLLTAQGKAAEGSAYSYLAGNRLLGGFAVLAYPAKYGISGVISFVVSHEGKIHEKDLGPETAAKALKMRSYNPDSSWK